MAKDELLDFKLQDKKIGDCFEFEIVMAIEPGRKPGLEYRNGNRSGMPSRAFRGQPVDPEWIAPSIQGKTHKARNKKIYRRHLLVYQNIPGGQTDFMKLLALVPEAERVWRSIWLIAGGPDMSARVLLSNAAAFACSLYEWSPNYEWAVPAC
ncbi:MAG: hypothetical protein C4293_19505 [Nitrospiraceae bacterium]